MSSARVYNNSGENRKEIGVKLEISGEEINELETCFQVLDQLKECEVQHIRKSRKFRKTNKPWNDHCLNSRKSIGALVYLYKEGKCNSTASFKNYYLKSGEDLQQYPDKDFCYHGRTIVELTQLAKQFHSILGSEYLFSEVCQYIWIRIFFETNEGVQRELKALLKFQLQNPELEIQSCGVEKDFKFAIDAEVFKSGRLIYAIQVKSMSYLKDQQVILKQTKRFNHRKQELYTKQYKVPVYHLIANKKGDILDFVMI